MREEDLFSSTMLAELPGLLGVALFAALSRINLRRLEDEDMLMGATSDEFGGVDAETGVYEERLLRPALDSELARARRFARQFALVMVGVDELRQRFDYRDQENWGKSFTATANLLRSTRTHIDRAYRFGSANFALILPESGEREVTGLIRRLRRVARQASPAEGEPGGPLPTHFGATFFPQCATTTDDLLRRAEVALRLADKNSTRIQIDGAEAPGMPPLETLRRETQPDETNAASEVLSEQATEGVSTVRAEQEEAAPSQPVPLRPYAAMIEAAMQEPVAEEMAPEELLAEPPALSTEIEDDKNFEIAAAAAEAEPVLSSEAEQAGPEARTAPTPITPLADKNGAAEQDASMDELMKHLDETLAMLRSLRTGTGP
jgi:diguanylate cyclase (GGDEF)-like protein